MDFDALGIVVIGRNEGQRLVDCLVSLESHKGRIVYVDSGSSDGSVSSAEGLGVFVVRLDMSQPFTAARARNEGFAAIMAMRPQTEFVQFVDGDCELDRDWLDAALAFMANRKDVAVVCGRRRERYPKQSVYNQLCDIEWNTPVGEASACGGDSLLRAIAFKQIGGFQPQLIAGEEPELCARLRQKGWTIWRLDAEMTRHDAAITHFSQWWARARRSGYGYAEVSALHPRSGIWGKEKARAIIWGGLLPLLIGVSAPFVPSMLWVVLIYPIQICQIALRRGPADIGNWIFALFITLAKFAELQGILNFYWGRLRGKKAELIEYKGND